MKEPINVNIHTRITCHCPYCEDYIDLYSDMTGQCIDIFEYAESGHTLETECPECGFVFEVILNINSRAK